jgi:hypothetical protein
MKLIDGGLILLGIIFIWWGWLYVQVDKEKDIFVICQKSKEKVIIYEGVKVECPDKNLTYKE